MSSASQANIVVHLIELRARIFRCLMVILLIFLSLYYFSSQIYTMLALPLLKHMPKGHSLIATQITAPFIAPLKLTLALAVFLGVPVILHQLWGFVSPALYLKERRWVFIFFVSSVMLFYLGVGFCYFLVLPMILAFFTHIAPEGVMVMPDISAYLDFALKLFFAFGMAFEVPVVIVLLVWTGIITTSKLVKKRPFVIVSCFIVAMLLTPPDIVSQSMLALPLCLLFELGLLLSRLLPI